MIGKTIQETFDAVRTPAELALWLRKWAAQGVELWDDDVLKLADAIERVSIGNAAAMRAALVKIEKLNHYDLGCVRSLPARLAIDAKILDIELTIRAALAAPARNCDVGTAEEQIKRFETFCNKSFDCGVLHGNCGACPLWTSGTMGHDCEIKWSQLPFAPAEGGAE